jgi:hypothetical protein
VEVFGGLLDVMAKFTGGLVVCWPEVKESELSMVGDGKCFSM